MEFKIESIAQEWRHLHAFEKYQGKDAVFKMASTQTTIPKTQNEFNFNEAFHLTPESSRPNIIVPENFYSGYYSKLFYFIAQRFLGEPLIDRNSTDLNVIAPRITQIAQATFEIGSLLIPSDCAFSQSTKPEPQKKKTIGESLLSASTEWASQVPKDLNEFLHIIQNSKNSLRTSLGHGDFVPRQLYDVDGKIGVIDGELAGIKGPKYYDVAQFYIRLRNDHDAKELAGQYLNEFKNLLSSSDKKSFWQELKPVLIQRYLGDLWGAAKNPRKLDQLEPLGKEILVDKIIN